MCVPVTIEPYSVMLLNESVVTSHSIAIKEIHSSEQLTNWIYFGGF